MSEYIVTLYVVGAIWFAILHGGHMKNTGKEYPSALIDAALWPLQICAIIGYALWPAKKDEMNDE